MSARLAIITLLVACGGHETPFPFAGPDAGYDALPPQNADAPGGAVTLTVTQGGMPAAGVTVYFQNADSTLVLAVGTDANGTAGAVVQPGGYVTVVEPHDGTGFDNLSTFAQIQPGDALHLDIKPVTPPSSTELRLVVPAAVGADSYQVYSSCGQFALDASATSQIELGECSTDFDVIVLALGGGSVIGGLYAPSVPLDTPTVTVDGSYAPMVTSSIGYTDVPSQIQWVNTYQAIMTSRGRLFDGTTGAPRTGTTIDGALTMPATTGTIGLTVTDGVPIASGLDEQLVYDWAPWTDSYSLDLGSAMLPTYASPPVFDIPTGGVLFGSGSSGVAPDLRRTTIHVSRPEIPQPRIWTWRLVGKAQELAVKFPLLPASPVDFNPKAGDSIGVDELTSAQVPGGYDAFRAHGFDNIERMIAGPTGRIVVELQYSPPL